VEMWPTIAPGRARVRLAVHQTLSDRDEHGPALSSIFRFHKAWVWCECETGAGRPAGVEDVRLSAAGAE